MTPEQSYALLAVIASMGAALVAVVRMQIRQMAARDTIATNFQNQLLEHLKKVREDDREVFTRLVSTQESILRRLETIIKVT